MSSSYSSSRTVQYQAYGSAGGGLQTNLVSGMSSAGAICTTQIRDAREREKREIGLLNDRLADYIEKVSGGNSTYMGLSLRSAWQDTTALPTALRSVIA